MASFLTAKGFFVTENEYPLISDYGDDFIPGWVLWANAIEKVFENTLFISSSKLLEIRSDYYCKIIFYPFKGKTYIVSEKKIDSFLQQYFPNKIVSDRNPAFYQFLIPFPKPYFEYGGYLNGRRNVVSISKFSDSTIRQIHGQDLVLKYIKIIEPIFIENISNAFDLSQQMNQYLSLFLNENIKVNPQYFLTPYYQLESSEIKLFRDYFDKFIKEVTTDQR